MAAESLNDLWYAWLKNAVAGSNPVTGSTYVVSKGTPTFTTGQVSVAATATLVVAGRSGRQSVKISNLGNTDVFVGGSGVTTTTGDLLVGSKGSTITIPTEGPVYAIAVTGTQSVSFIEVH